MSDFHDHRPRKRRSIESRFEAKVDRSGECWLWTAGTARSSYHRRNGLPGYGVFHDGARQVMAHRWAYERFVGPIPAGYEIDHVCHSTLCVRPDHLRAATHAQNLQNRKGSASHASSGVRGVMRDGNRWRVQVKVGDRVFAGGTFATVEDAEPAARELRRRVMTHTLS